MNLCHMPIKRTKSVTELIETADTKIEHVSIFALKYSLEACLIVQFCNFK